MIAQYNRVSLAAAIAGLRRRRVWTAEFTSRAAGGHLSHATPAALSCSRSSDNAEIILAIDCWRRRSVRAAARFSLPRGAHRGVYIGGARPIPPFRDDRPWAADIQRARRAAQDPVLDTAAARRRRTMIDGDIRRILAKKGGARDILRGAVALERGLSMISRFSVSSMSPRQSTRPRCDTVTRLPARARRARPGQTSRVPPCRACIPGAP